MVPLQESSTSTEEVRVTLGAQGRNVGDRGLPSWGVCMRSFGLVLCEEKGGGEAAQVSRNVLRC